MVLRRDGGGLTVRSPSKINLTLDIRKRRSDGFHDIETVFAALEFGDDLAFAIEPDNALTLRVRDCTGGLSTPLPVDSRNLIMQAAELLRERAGCRSGAAITLWKRVPVEAGLGGGSANAAATLLALNNLWSLNLGRDRLTEMAAELGSDVAFFVSGVPYAVGRGRGEEIEQIPSPLRLQVVLVKPASGLSAGAVYRAVEPGDTEETTRMIRGLEHGDFADVVSALSNGLQEPAQRLSSEVSKVCDAMRRELPGRVLMSGSGTTCFAISRSKREVSRVAERLRQQRLGHVFVTHTL
ncbi:4-(cytidine 5'-diphospho)-2-C-methyl-D-erythritol kinase [Stratiformator vulcanicus]|uniref:4-diphosphocytidyl-2-C-methyl-D-erythritol kinase n=1 Tax=Stratiformator vulcanicus TaxID=2527980 RepID=A0A517R2I2_9PLAN|nr:4-(cytidine 5'-diphospho)-2-C-methyl-D-erythritol kinase [Stratiformator vulcanicus]QDT38064.1 4-diphosphocytidyl-2-C-methyl-D-erythritol kinase [Stratiformator vulcanicus]